MKFNARFGMLLSLIFLLNTAFAFGQYRYRKIFTGERLRMDFNMQGNSSFCEIEKEEFIREPVWGRHRVHLLDTFLYGEMKIEMFDSLTGQLIYSRGQSTRFQEWQSTKFAAIKDSFIRETILMPFPRSSVKLVISIRNAIDFHPLRTIWFNPDDPVITHPNPFPDYELVKNMVKRKPENKLDIVFISEGYTAEERMNFLTRTEDLINRFLKWEPYTKFTEDINFYSLFVPSTESGVDDPVDSIWIETALDLSFNTFGDDRYMTPANMQKIYDIVSDIPFDQLCILVNTDKYGGGGIYNSFTTLSAENEYTEFLLLHEFGHAFASLADEYYTSSVSYSEYFDYSVEPYQPNITTLVNFASKWESMVPDTIPVPTPDSSIYENVVGVFEGAGYSEKGIYRPFRTCTMKSKSTLYYCPVCQKAIADMLRFYTSDD